MPPRWALFKLGRPRTMDFTAMLLSKRHVGWTSSRPGLQRLEQAGVRSPTSGVGHPTPGVCGDPGEGSKSNPRGLDLEPQKFGGIRAGL